MDYKKSFESLLSLVKDFRGGDIDLKNFFKEFDKEDFFK